MAKKYFGNLDCWYLFYNQPPMVIVSYDNVYVATNTHVDTVQDNVTPWNTESDQVGIHNLYRSFIIHQIEDFEEPFTKVNCSIWGFGGVRTCNLTIGTIIWNCGNNNRKSHQFNIQNSYYTPNGNVRILIPHHWSKKYGSIIRYYKGTGNTQTDFNTELFLNDGKKTGRIPGKDRQYCYLIFSTSIKMVWFVITKRRSPLYSDSGGSPYGIWYSSGNRRRGWQWRNA